MIHFAPSEIWKTYIQFSCFIVAKSTIWERDENQALTTKAYKKSQWLYNADKFGKFVVLRANHAFYERFAAKMKINAAVANPAATSLEYGDWEDTGSAITLYEHLDKSGDTLNSATSDKLLAKLALHCIAAILTTKSHSCAV